MKKNLIIKLMIKFKFERRHPPQAGSLSRRDQAASMPRGESERRKGRGYLAQ